MDKTNVPYLIARVQFKNDSRKAAYIYRSGDGATQYHVSVFNGKICSCDCPVRKKECKHYLDAQAREDARQPKSEPTCQGMVLASYRETSNLSSNKAFSLMR